MEAADLKQALGLAAAEAEQRSARDVAGTEKRRAEELARQMKVQEQLARLGLQPGQEEEMLKMLEKEEVRRKAVEEEEARLRAEEEEKLRKLEMDHLERESKLRATEAE